MHCVLLWSVEQGAREAVGSSLRCKVEGDDAGIFETQQEMKEKKCLIRRITEIVVDSRCDSDTDRHAKASRKEQAQSTKKHKA